jgi:hypothetical protein
MNIPVVVLQELPRGARLRLPLGQGPAVLGFATDGWETVSRPGARAITRWTGVSPNSLEIPFLLDGYADRRSIQAERDRLLVLARPKGNGPPPVLKLSGPVDHRGLRWVIVEIAWGASIRHPSRGLLRQAGTVRLMQYVRPDRVRVRRLPRMTSQWGPVDARKGDTWRKLAARHLSDAARWKEIARLNGNKPATATRELKAGRRVRLP